VNKTEVKKLTNIIKGYYNNQFFVDDYVLEAWYESMKPYELEDAEEHLQTYLKEYPDIPPKPHTFKNGLYTPEQKERMKNTNYTIQCNLCGRWMSVQEYDAHYERCLDIQYLLDVAKQKGEQYTREDLENCRAGVIDKLLEKYPPKKIAMESIGELFKW
jgi:hypothetical protein